MPEYPKELKYTKEHEWARQDGELVRIGITEHAVEQLGDVTLIDLPEVGSQVERDAHFGDIESVKAVSELFSPLTGEIVECNAALEDEPERVNDDPYGNGWMIAVKPANPADFDTLMDAAAYEAFLGTL